MNYREVTASWQVTYQEDRFPFVQKGWVLPAERMKETDPFILMAEDWFKRGAFADHPHRGFQTVTYVLDGQLEHKDNSGGHTILEPGDMQYMNAGWAARHAEEAVGDGIVHTLQLWLNLPASLKDTKTSYENVYSKDAETRQLPDGGELKVFSGNIGGLQGPLDPLVSFAMGEVTLLEGEAADIAIPANHFAFVYVISGEVKAGREEPVTLKRASTALLGGSDEQADPQESTYLRLQSSHRQTKVLLYSGEPIGEPIVTGGPFVMNTEAEIQEAFADFRAGKFGGSVKT